MDIGEGITFGQGINITAAGPRSLRAIFGYGSTGGSSTLSLTNIVSNTGVVGNNVTGVGTARQFLAASGYGGDKAIFGYGTTTSGGAGITTITNLVSNNGVVANDVTNASTTGRYGLAAATYGVDKAIFGFGRVAAGGGAATTITTLVTNSGVVGTDTTNAGYTARYYLAAASYGLDKAIFAYGDNATAISSKVDNNGILVSEDAVAGTSRYYLAAAGYGLDKAIFGYGTDSITYLSMTNLVDENGDIASDTTGVGTAREGLAATTYDGDKAIFGYGRISTFPGFLTITNLVDNNGVVANDVTNASTTGRAYLAASSFG